MATVYFEKEYDREKQEWKRASFIAATIMNMSGRSLKRNKNIRPEDLISFPDEKQEVNAEELKRLAVEGLQEHKKKFWTKIKDESLEKIMEK